MKAKEYQANSFLTDKGEDLVTSKANTHNPSFTGQGKFESSVQVGDNTELANKENVGAIRYREGKKGNSYVDMCMKIEKDKYAWMNILTNFY